MSGGILTMAPIASNTAYLQRRGQIEDYFDRTALKAWEQLTSTAPVGRIRATVRAGRERMRAQLLDWDNEDYLSPNWRAPTTERR